MIPPRPRPGHCLGVECQQRNLTLPGLLEPLGATTSSIATICLPLDHGSAVAIPYCGHMFGAIAFYYYTRLYESTPLQERLRDLEWL